MPYRLDVQLEAPFELDPLVLAAELEGGAVTLVHLKAGRAACELTAPVRRVRLLLEPKPAERAAALPCAEAGPAPSVAAVPVEVETLFDPGVVVPTGGALRLEVRWGGACLAPDPEQRDTRRFASWEHVLCAAAVGKDSALDGAAPLELNGVQAWFDAKTPLPVAQRSFGEIVALGGDFYAHLDDAARASFDWAWPKLDGFAGWLAGRDYRATTLAGDSAKGVRDLLDAIARDREGKNAVHDFLAALKGSFPAQRYLALASQNHCHFSCPEPGAGETTNPALRLYRGYHERALREAVEARDAAKHPDGQAAFLWALATEAFGCHFLTDLFATGHMRVPRRLLATAYGTLRGALAMSKTMHDEDNRLGLWVRRRLGEPGQPPVVWLAYGDSKLRSDEAEVHRHQVVEAVRRSAAEVFGAYCGVELPLLERAEAMIPVALPPGVPADPTSGNLSTPLALTPNHWPLYWFDASGRVLKRLGKPDQQDYALVEDLETAANAWPAG
jgi:hypothetical protein